MESPKHRMPRQANRTSNDPLGSPRPVEPKKAIVLIDPFRGWTCATAACRTRLSPVRAPPIDDFGPAAVFQAAFAEGKAFTLAFGQRASCLTKSMGYARRSQGQAKTCRAETSNCPRGFCIADGSPLRLLLGKRRPGRLFGAIRSAVYFTRAARAVIRSAVMELRAAGLRPPLQCGSPVRRARQLRSGAR